MTTRHLLAAAVLAACSLGASMGALAQSMKPGLWEINNKIGGSPDMDKAMAQMQQEMASMPPEQRKMMQDMMSKQGVSMGPGGGGGMSVKVCVTKEMAERNEMPQQSQGDCKTTMGSRSGNTQKISFVCTQPPSTGEGEITYNGPESYAMKMTTNTTVRGKPEKMTMDGTGKWQAADCGAIKPGALPKK